MSDENPTQTGDLGEQPEPQIEPRRAEPGWRGRRARGRRQRPGRPRAGDQPAVEETPDPLKKVLAEGEDTETEATESDDGSDEDVEPHEESPA